MKVTRKIKQPISDEKILSNAGKMSQLEEDIEQIKADLMAYRKECNQKREAKEKELATLLKTVSTGSEDIDVDCEELIDMDTHTKSVVRCDTGDVVETRDLTAIEIGREKKRLEKVE